mgnify:CR=1 FL=1
MERPNRTVSSSQPWSLASSRSTVNVRFATPWRPSWTFSVESVRRLGAFAGNLFGENLFYQAGKNLGNLLIGRFLDLRLRGRARSARKLLKGHRLMRGGWWVVGLAAALGRD